MGRRATNTDTQFREATDQFGPALRRLVRGYEAAPDLQEELLQDILLALWRALPTFRGEASLRTFVFRVAHNTAIRHVHKASRDRSEPGLEADQTAGPAPAHDERLDRAAQRARLTAAIRRLPDLDREVVLLSLEGLSHQEIASISGLTATNVGTRLSRARKRLAQKVGGAR